jgi:site-specific DNA recombinase
MLKLVRSTMNHNLANVSKIAIYCRVSSEEQKQGKTINSQIQELEDFARANNYKITERYIDDGWSGALLERPALDRLRDDGSKGIFEGVLINDVDRLSREVLHLGIIKKDLEKKGIKLIFKKLPNNGDPISNFMINMLGSFAEFERELIADRVRRGKRYKVENRNLIMGNIPPFGYRYIKKIKETEGHYEINEKEAKLVKKMFNWAAEKGLSQRGVLKKLVEEGIPARKSLKWSKSSVSRILTNSTYIGITYYYKHQAVEIENRGGQFKYFKQKRKGTRLRAKGEWISIKLPDHLKLVDEKTFYATQAQFQRNKCYASRNNTKNFYLLRGLVKCGLCGSSYTGNPCHGKLYYRCGNRLKTFPRPKECKASIISVSKLDNAVWGNITNAIQNPDIIFKQIEKFKEKQRTQPSQIEENIIKIEKRLESLYIEEKRLFEAYRRQVIEIDQFEREIRELNKEKGQLNSELEGLKNKNISEPLKEEAITSIEEYCRGFKDKLGQFTLEEKQTFLRFLLDGIIIENKKVRILGLLPLNMPLGSSSGNIALQTIYKREHNTAFKFELEVKL